MPPAQFDGLWHCLCPSFRRTLSAPLARSLIRVKTTRQHRSQSQKTQYVDHGPDPQSWSETFKPGLRPRSLGSRKAEKWPLLSKAHAIPNLSTKDAYEELRQAASQGDYGRAREYVKILVKGRGEKPSLQLYHAMILANTSAQYGSPNEVASLLQEMVEEGIPPDSAIYHAALKVLSIHPDYLLRKEIMEKLYQKWFTLTADGWHDVIAGLIRDRQLEVAMNNLNVAEQQGIKIKSWLYDTLVYTLCDITEFNEALKIMQRRYFSGEADLSVTLWYHLLDSASRSFHHDTVTFVWRNHVERGHIKPPSGICINVLNTAARHGDSKLATSVIHTLSSRKNTFEHYHYEALIESWLGSNNLKAAFTILSVMLQTRVPPAEGSTRAIYLYLCDDYGRPAESLQILRRLKDEDRPIPHAAVNVVLEAYIHYNDLGSALETYKSMHMIIPSGPDTSTFNTLLRGCSQARRKDLAMFLASEMLALNIPPNALTYDRLILNCLSAQGEADGGFEDAWRYFEEMKQMDWWPRAKTLKELGAAGCAMADERVWGLVHERGFDERRMSYLTNGHWGKRVGKWKGEGDEENAGREGEEQ